MNRFLMRKATEDVAVVVRATGETIEGRELTGLLEKLVELNGYLLKLERRLKDRRALDLIFGVLAGAGGLLQKEGRKLHEIFANADLIAQVEEVLVNGGYQAERTFDEEHRTHGLDLLHPESGAVIHFDRELATHVEFQRGIEVAKSLVLLSRPPFLVRSGERETEVASPEELLEHILTAAKKDLTIQRYKGLGEMNPEQLWETTMDPEKRTLLQVRIDDVVETDEIFTVLMGDQVEPRRRFIEENALDVKNLDI